MKQLLLTSIISAFCVAASAQDVQTVCPGAETSYHVDDPEADSKYIWRTDPVGAGVIIEDAAINGRVTVKWNAEGTLWVYEENSAGCQGEESGVTVKFAAPLSAQFDDVSVCYGDKLNIVLPDNAARPFDIIYKVDNVEFKVENFDGTVYTMPTKAGSYQIMKVTDANGCELVPGSDDPNAKAVIKRQLNKLTITKEGK